MKKNDLILFIISGENIPSARFRVLQLLPYFKNIIKLQEIYLKPNLYWRWNSFIHSRNIIYKIMNKINNIFQINALIIDIFRLITFIRILMLKPKAVFIQKSFAIDSLIFWEKLFYLFNIKYLFDLDDALMLNLTGDIYLKRNKRFTYIFNHAEKTIVGNKFLTDFVGNDNVVIIPTVVDTNKYIPMNNGRDHESLRIGWTGTSGNFVYIYKVEKIISKLIEKYNIELLIIADKEPSFKKIQNEKIHFIKWNKSTEIKDLNKIDIGIMPLLDNNWAKGKCGFKIIQYMATGKPVVASPVGINSLIINHGGNGYLAETEAEWCFSLERLITDEKLRHRFGENGRRTVEKSYSISSVLPIYIDLFRNI